MKRLLPIFVAFVLLFTFLAKSSSLSFVFVPKGSLNTEITGRVGELSLDVSGYISPYASVIMTTSITGSAGGSRDFIRSTVADREGNFYMTAIPIRKGFSGFCLDAVDFQRLGESEVCFSFPPAEKSMVMKDLFLPPTIGLQRAEVVEGSTAYAFGYTMPRAIVTLNLNESKVVVSQENGKPVAFNTESGSTHGSTPTSDVLGASYVKGQYDINRENAAKIRAIADKKGLYEFPIKNLKMGSYKLFSTAFYKDKESLKPSSSKELKVLSWWEQLLAFLRDLWNAILRLLTSITLGPLWLAIPILILIIILLYKLYRDKVIHLVDRFPSIKNRWYAIRKRFGKKKLHHSWFVGY